MITNSNGTKRLEATDNVTLDNFNAITDAMDTSKVSKTGDTVSLASNGLTVGTSQLVVSGGNVGVGTNSPNASYKLDVQSASNAFARVKTTNANSISLIDIDSSSNSSAYLRFLSGGVETGRIFGQSNNDIIIANGAEVERLRITSAGNVGIGTSSPSAKLHVIGGKMFLGNTPEATTGALIHARDTFANGTNTSFGSLFFASSPGTDFAIGKVSENSVGSFAIRSGSGTEFMRITDTGNVGIGTSSPQDRFHVNGNGIIAGHHLQLDGSIELNKFGSGNRFSYIDFHTDDTNTDYSFRIIRENTGVNASTYLKHLGTGTLCLVAENAGFLTFATNNTERMRIDANGNVLIGTTSPLQNNTHTFVSSGYSVLALRNSGAAAGRYHRVGSDSGGNFLIYNENVVGVYLGYGATSWSANSDERLKTKLTPFENTLSKIQTLRSGIGRYLTDDENVSRSFLIAQDVQNVLPEAVDVQQDGTLSLRYTDLIPFLVASIQELYAEVQILKGAN